MVVTTSGTAVANLHPAVLEAHHAGLPLVVLSADRPHELRGTGANQTTAQPGIFGASTRWSADLPAPVVRRGLPPFWRSTVCRALAAATGATGGEPGPVHLNVSLREPLVPDAAAPEWPDALDGRRGGAPWVRRGSPRRAPAGLAPDVERTLVLVGRTRDPRLGEAAVDWAAGRGHPVVAEPFGHRRVRAAGLPHGPLVLTATEWLDAHEPERVVVVGRVTLSRAVGALLRRPGVRVEVVSEGAQWPDPSHVAAAVHPPSALAPATDVSRAVGGEWAERWHAAGRNLADAVAAQQFPWPSGLAVAQAVADVAAGRRPPRRRLLQPRPRPRPRRRGPCRRRGPRQPWSRRHRRRRVDRARCGAR